jgi:isopentenyl diphosphate isomerase/L-lactate dehydrogenase-like FMN-dependent dehydrogenase
MSVQAIGHPEGELATARAAGAAGVPFILSTMSSRSMEEVVAAAPGGTRWFQLYLQGDPAISRSLVERAVAADYGAIVLTVDLPVLGYRERDMRSGFGLPPLGNFAANPPSHRAGLRNIIEGDDGRLPFATPTWADIATIRSWSNLPLVLKGILTAEDARLAVEHGVDGIIVSNHGARQLDRSPAPIDVLAEVVATVDGRTEVWVDGGVRRGLDIAIAVALGARGVLLGKPVFWALAAGGQAGVERALAIVRQEFEIALALLGAPDPSQLRPEHIVDAPAPPA